MVWAGEAPEAGPSPAQVPALRTPELGGTGPVPEAGVPDLRPRDVLGEPLDGLAKVRNALVAKKFVAMGVAGTVGTLLAVGLEALNHPEKQPPDPEDIPPHTAHQVLVAMAIIGIIVMSVGFAGAAASRRWYRIDDSNDATDPQLGHRMAETLRSALAERAPEGLLRHLEGLRQKLTSTELKRELQKGYEASGIRRALERLCSADPDVGQDGAREMASLVSVNDALKFPSPARIESKLLSRLIRAAPLNDPVWNMDLRRRVENRIFSVGRSPDHPELRCSPEAANWWRDRRPAGSAEFAEMAGTARGNALQLLRRHLVAARTANGRPTDGEIDERLAPFEDESPAEPPV